MNRVVILQTWHGRGSGAERVLEYLLQGAVSRREEICLLAPESSTVTQCARDLGYAWIPWRTSWDALLKNGRAFLQLLREDGKIPLGDCVHAWHARNFEWSLALGRRWRIPCAGTLHDDPSPAHHQFSPVRKVLIRQSATRFDGFVAVSHAVARRCAELGWAADTVVIPNGLPDAPVAARIPGDTFRVGFMGTSVLWKGLALVPELAHRLADLPVEWHLFGPESPETAPLLRSLRAHPGVTCHGFTPLEAALPRMDVLLHLSLALDPYPTVLLEAARAGLPAIASRTGGSPEIVDDGATGLLVPPGDVDATAAAIRRLFSEKSRRLEMARAARRRFEERFRVERMVADYFAFWDRLRLPRPRS